MWGPLLESLGVEAAMVVIGPAQILFFLVNLVVAPLHLLLLRRVGWGPFYPFYHPETHLFLKPHQKGISLVGFCGPYS